jgi:Integrase zinc binding domain
LAQYDYEIVYIPGEANIIADALSCLPDTVDDPAVVPIAATLSVQTNPILLKIIKSGYDKDPFCLKISNAQKSINSLEWRHNSLLYIGNCLVIPRVGTLREDLFHLVHDSLRHFGFVKSYTSLWDSYYWPNMQSDLKNSYLPACIDCQCDKGRTSKPTGPLHPLPIPDQWGDSIAIDFIGPLPLDNGFDAIMTITDRLGSDICIAPTHIDITAKQFAAQFFNLWYCENSLPLNIVLDHEKSFVTKFCKALTKLTRMKLKMSSSYHPETDGASEHLNKMVVQCLHFHVERTQSGWLRALLLVRFNIMNTINVSTGFSPFQLRMGQSPRLIPPLISNDMSVPDEINHSSR